MDKENVEEMIEMFTYF